MELMADCRHLKYTIPPAIVLSALYRPLATRLDVYKVAFLITVCLKPIRYYVKLTILGCRCFDHSVGLIPDSHWHMELPQPCDHRS